VPGAQREKAAATFRLQRLLMHLAEWTGLEPATPGVTGRYSNQLNYHSTRSFKFLRTSSATATWRPLGDSNPCYNRERVVS
jgi:hypothetical protein